MTTLKLNKTHLRSDYREQFYFFIAGPRRFLFITFVLQTLIEVFTYSKASKIVLFFQGAKERSHI